MVFAISGIVLLYVYQDSLLYLPTMPIQYPHENRRGYQSPDQMEIDFQNVTLVARDGVRIRGWLMFPNEA